MISGQKLVVEDSGERKELQLAGIQAPGPHAPAAFDASRSVLMDRVLRRQVRFILQPDVPGSPPAAIVYLTSETNSVNEALVGDGFAFVDQGQKIDKEVSGRLETVEAAAMARLLGLWGPVDILRRSPAGPDKERFALGWLKLGDNLKTHNPNAAKEWYRRIINEHPDTAAAEQAKKRLGIPVVERKELPLNSETAIKLLPKLREGEKMTRPNVSREMSTTR